MEQPNIFAYIPDNQYDYKKVFSDKDKPIRLFQAFSGIGCQAMAFNRLGISYVNVGTSEIDKYAILSYEAIHGDSNNFGDISKMKEIPPCDIFTWSFPCTDLSKAGKQMGLQGGTRSGLVYEVLRLLHATETKPKVLIMENVVDLVQVKFAAEFYEIQNEIASFGYKNYTQVLNAKHYGVAQNRERVFMVSILGNEHYEFPPRIPLKKRLKDYLEEKVDEKYYLSNKLIKCFEEHKERNDANGNGFSWKSRTEDDTATAITDNAGSRPADNFIIEPVLKQVAQIESKGFTESTGRVYDANGLPPTIQTLQGGNREPKVAETICLNSKVNGKQPSLQDRIYSSEGVAAAITDAFRPNIEGYSRIRKLTPKECWRLMGIDDADFEKAAKVCSNSQLYKQAGNGIVVDVFAAILKGLTQ